MEREDRETFIELLSTVPLLFLAFLAPVLAYNSMFIFGNDKPEIWFQRSGSITVFFAVWAEYGLSKINGHVNPTGVIVSQQVELSEKYKTPYYIAKYLGVIMALIGTLIWGYGDLIWLQNNA